MTSKAGVFRVSLEPVLGLLSEHLYQRPELFLRELICNSYDAVILRTETHNGNIEGQNIEVQCDGRKCLSIKDGGVGMSESELERFLANVGSSATKDAKCYQQSVIGEFGLGFLSVLAVAESVEVVTRRAGENDAYRWVWQGGTSYRIEHAGRVDVGTTVRVRFRSQHCHFADAQVVSELVCRYVPYLAIGIRINQLADPRTTPAAWKGQDTGRWGLPPARGVVHGFGFASTAVAGSLQINRDATVPPAVTLYRRGVLIDRTSAAFMPNGWGWWSGELELRYVKLTLDRGAVQEDAELARCRTEIARVLSEELARMMREHGLILEVLKTYRGDVAQLLANDPSMLGVRSLYPFKTSVGDLAFEQILAMLPQREARAIRYIRANPTEDSRWSVARVQRLPVVWCQSDAEEALLCTLVRESSRCSAEILTWGQQLDSNPELVVPGELSNWFSRIAAHLGSRGIDVEPTAFQAPELISAAELSPSGERDQPLGRGITGTVAQLMGQVFPTWNGPTGRLLLNVQSRRLRDFAIRTDRNIALSSAILLAIGVFRSGAAIQAHWSELLDELFEQALINDCSPDDRHVATRHVTAFFAHEFSRHKKQLRALRKVFEAEPYAWEVKSADEEVVEPMLFNNVLSLVRASDVVFADVSTLNPNVLLELGLAIGLGKSVVVLHPHAGAARFANLRGHLTLQYEPEADDAGVEEAMRIWATRSSLFRGLRRPEPFLGYRLLAEVGTLTTVEVERVHSRYGVPFDFLSASAIEVVRVTGLDLRRAAAAQDFLRQRLERHQRHLMGTAG